MKLEYIKNGDYYITTLIAQNKKDFKLGKYT